MSLRDRIATRLRDLPIRRKLRFTIVATTGLALFLAGFGIVAADALLFFNFLRRDLSTLVQIIGDNCKGALAFDDSKAAAETLGALRARSHVQLACLYHSSGRLFASYRRPDAPQVCPTGTRDRTVFQDGAFIASRSIELEDKPIGGLVLVYELDEIYERIAMHGITVLAALLLSCWITLMLSSRLRRWLAEPILELAGIARSVSQSEDYSIRAVPRSTDEVGSLAEALNQMMDGIQSRDAELRKALEDQRDALAQLAHANSDLKRSNDDLALSNKDLERFAFMASHDLQEPLRMITSYTQLLLRERQTVNSDHAADYATQIVGGTRRMRALLTDVLAYTEVAGSVRQPTELVSLDGVVQKVRNTLRERIEECHAEINAGPLPLLQAHESRMISLFQNLLENAIKYRRPGLPPSVRVFSFSHDGFFEFNIADNGIGIEPAYRERIFIAFERLHGKEIPGTGIGLAICQRIVERYGGRIWVESDPGAGSTFHFTLPTSMSGESVV